MATLVKDPRNIPHSVLGEVSDTTQELNNVVLDKAFDMFGYTAHVAHGGAILGRLLTKLAIQPLDYMSVEAYKASKISSYTIPKRLLGFLFFTLFIPGLLVLAWTHLLMSHSPAPVLITFVGGILVILSFTSGNEWVSTRIRNVKVTKDWKVFHLTKSSVGYDKYKRFVPIFALNYATQIVAELPGVSVQVHELFVQRADINLPDPDPFMSVEYGNEKYYIAVWDERDYEQANRSS